MLDNLLYASSRTRIIFPVIVYLEVTLLDDASTDIVANVTYRSAIVNTPRLHIVQQILKNVGKNFALSCSHMASELLRGR